MDRPNKRVNEFLKASLKLVIKPYLSSYLRTLLEENKNPDGSKHPSTPPQGRKTEKTIRAYKKRGYNTETYLVATGESTRLRFNFSNGGKTLTVRPSRPEILSYHIPKSAHRGEIQWMQLNNESRSFIINQMKKDLAGAFK